MSARKMSEKEVLLSELRRLSRGLLDFHRRMLTARRAFKKLRVSKKAAEKMLSLRPFIQSKEYGKSKMRRVVSKCESALKKVVKSRGVPSSELLNLIRINLQSVGDGASKRRRRRATAELVTICETVLALPSNAPA